MINSVSNLGSLLGSSALEGDSTWNGKNVCSIGNEHQGVIAGADAQMFNGLGTSILIAGVILGGALMVTTAGFTSLAILSPGSIPKVLAIAAVVVGGIYAAYAYKGSN